jgi:hypothetical protein
VTARRALAALLLLPLACGGERDARPDASGVADSVMTTELGPGRFDFGNPRAGTASLAGYESALTVSFDGTRAGAPLRWSTRYRYQAVKSPAARLLRVEESGPGAPATSAFMAERDGVRYRWGAETRGAKPRCLAVAIEPADSALPPLDPAASLPGVLGAEEAGTATVHGVKAAHYTFDERAVGLAGAGTAKGGLWVAPKGGHLLRYRLETVADTAYFGGGVRGTLTWDYELTPAARPEAIALPDGCPPGVPDAPRPADASEVEQHPGVLRYRTAGSVADAAMFAAKELEAKGWTQPAAAGPGAGPASGTMAAMLEEAMKAQPELRKAMEDPETRKAMERAGLRMPGVNASAVSPPAPGETHMLFTRGDRTLRVLVTAGEKGAEVVVLGR